MSTRHGTSSSTTPAPLGRPYCWDLAWKTAWSVYTIRPRPHLGLFLDKAAELTAACSGCWYFRIIKYLILSLQSSALFFVLSAVWAHPFFGKQNLWDFLCLIRKAIHTCALTKEWRVVIFHSLTSTRERIYALSSKVKNIPPPKKKLNVSPFFHPRAFLHDGEKTTFIYRAQI
jgi:hypothetical protein